MNDTVCPRCGSENVYTFSNSYHEEFGDPLPGSGNHWEGTVTDTILKCGDCGEEVVIDTQYS